MKVVNSPGTGTIDDDLKLRTVLLLLTVRKQLDTQVHVSLKDTKDQVLIIEILFIYTGMFY